MMEAPPSEFDKPGYIYAFHLQGMFNLALPSPVVDV